MNSVSALLSKLHLDRYVEIFEEEAITETELLTSMGAEMLRTNLEELGLESGAIDQLAAELFPGEHIVHQAITGGPMAEDEQVILEENAVAEAPVPSGGDKLPEDLTQAAEAEAQWLLSPLSMLDLSHTKTMLMDKMREGIDFQRRGQFANARAVFSKALSFDAPNRRMTAAIYYNRSACQRQLGQLSLALRDAQLAAENDPSNVRAWWRAADVAIVLGDVESAWDAITAGLKVNPRCQSLLALKLRCKRHT